MSSGAGSDGSPALPSPPAWRSLADVPADLGDAAVCLGVFDGVHRGHREVVARTAAAARRTGAVPVALTFDPHPVEVVRPGTTVARLATLARRVALLRAAGAAEVLVLPFTTELAAQGPEDFVAGVLRDRLHASTVVVGADFRFGHRAAGDVATLRRLGLEVDAVEPVGGTQGERFSSTAIRAALAAGDLPTARHALGHPYLLEGTVVRGDQRGRELGYPTANLDVAPGLLVPADGVYAGRLRVDGGGEWLPAAVSIGTNPTFDGTEQRVEAHVLDRTGLDLYGAAVELDLLERLRPTERFADVAALVRQMDADVVRARAVIAAQDALLP